MTEDVDQTLLDLLAEERQAMLTGRFAAFPDLARRKEAAFARLEQAGLGCTALRRIGAQVSRNQRLLGAALRGLRDVGDRLGQVRDLRDGFSTYDSQGQKSTVAGPRPGFEHKA